MTLSKPQFKALWTAFKKGGAAYVSTSRMGGANRRMIERMANLNLLNEDPPFPITLKGMRALHSACRERWAKRGCMAYQDDLKEVETALRIPHTS
jgi:hypothetical protein